MSPYGLFALSNPGVTRASSSLMIYEAVGAVWVSNPCVICDTGSLIIYESLGAVCAVEFVRLPRPQFLDDF
jgi:hypothetical protein